MFIGLDTFSTHGKPLYSMLALTSFWGRFFPFSGCVDTMCLCEPQADKMSMSDKMGMNGMYFRIRQVVDNQ